MSTLLPSSLRWLHPLGSERAALSPVPLPPAMEPDIHTFHIFFENYLLQSLPSRSFCITSQLSASFLPAVRTISEEGSNSSSRGAELLSVRRLWRGRVMAKQSVLICRCHPFIWKPAKDRCLYSFCPRKLTAQTPKSFPCSLFPLWAGPHELSSDYRYVGGQDASLEFS